MDVPLPIYLHLARGRVREKKKKVRKKKLISSSYSIYTKVILAVVYIKDQIKIYCEKSLRYIENELGPSTDACGTPYEMLS